MNRLKSVLLSVAMIAGVGVAPLLATTAPAYALTAKQQLCEGATGSTACATSSASTDIPGLIRNVVNILLFIVGAASVIMIVIAGIRYTTSGGDSSAVNGAKNTILYSIVGLVVAFMAYGIVNFVVTRL